MTINILAFLIAYFICSINFAIIITKLVKGEDIRKFGSGNAGTTNSIRVMGKFWGIMTFIGDICKTIIAYYLIYLIAKLFNIEYDISARSFYLVGAIIGHCYPVYYKFKGGKGVATTIAAMMLINKEVTLVAIIVGVIITVISRMISLASISAMILLNVMAFVMLPEYILPIFIITIIIIYKHKENIDRIIKGKENKLFERRK